MRPVFLLGASNVTRSFPLIIRLIEQGVSGPVHILGAHGHGRSYGKWSLVGIRSLSGIRDCELWDELPERGTTQRPLGFITDVGNDLVYGFPVETILDWVRECADRLANLNTEIVMTTPPMETLRGLSGPRFQLFRIMLFPGSRPTLPELLRKVEMLDAGLRGIACEVGAKIAVPNPTWYGFDPIHIRRRDARTAWTSYLSKWEAFNQHGERSTDSSIRIPFLRRPRHRRVLGMQQNTAQPIINSARLHVSLF